MQAVADRTNSAPSSLRREPALMSIDETRELTKRAKSDTQLLPPPPPLPRTGRAPVKVSSSCLQNYTVRMSHYLTPCFSALSELVKQDKLY